MVSESDILSANVLLVDDEEANVLLLRRTLSAARYVSIASTVNPREVLELHRKNRYDLIVLDLQMPDMDGFEVMEDLKEIERDGYLPVLVITAQPQHKLRALKAGARDFVSKPLDLAEVVMRVHNMLEVRLLHRKTKALYDQVVEQQKVSERLLLNVLPQTGFPVGGAREHRAQGDRPDEDMVSDGQERLGPVPLSWSMRRQF